MTTTEIHSISILILFAIYFLVQIRSIFRKRTFLSYRWSVKKLKCLSWSDFELLTMELFAKLGWKVIGNEKKGADGGVDIWMQKISFTKKNHSAIVQCKRYEDALVTIKVIREMYGLMYEYDVDEVYVVTTSRFTKECYKFIEGKQITLINGEQLVQLIAKVM